MSQVHQPSKQCTNQANSGPPTDFTDLHRLFGCVDSPTEYADFTELLAEVVLPQISQICTELLAGDGLPQNTLNSQNFWLRIFSHRLHRFTQKLLTSGGHLSQVHQHSKRCTNVARLVHLRQVHPLEGTQTICADLWILWENLRTQTICVDL